MTLRPVIIMIFLNKIHEIASSKYLYTFILRFSQEKSERIIQVVYFHLFDTRKTTKNLPYQSFTSRQNEVVSKKYYSTMVFSYS